MNEKSLNKISTITLINDLKYYQNYKIDCLTFFKDTKEGHKYDKHILEIETELMRRGVDFK